MLVNFFQKHFLKFDVLSQIQLKQITMHYSLVYLEEVHAAVDEESSPTV